MTSALLATTALNGLGPVFSWDTTLENLETDQAQAIRGSGEGWIVWSRGGGALAIAVRGDDNQTVRMHFIDPQSSIADVLAAQRWLASLSPSETARAVEALTLASAGVTVDD